MRIIFVRHGHPDYARDCLTPLGHRHAEAAAQRLKDEGVVQIFSSTCGRALETADHLAQIAGVPVQKCDFMREVSWGSADGSPMVEDGHPWSVADRMVNHGQPLMDFGWREREGYRGSRLLSCAEHVAAGADEWLARLGYTREGHYYRAGRYTNRTVAAFGHGGESAALLSHMFNLPLPFVCAAMGPDYTGITIVTLPDWPGELVSPRFELMNDARHIAGIRAENVYGN